MDKTLNYIAKFVLHCEKKNSMQQNAYELNVLKIAKRSLCNNLDVLWSSNGSWTFRGFPLEWWACSSKVFDQKRSRACSVEHDF